VQLHLYININNNFVNINVEVEFLVLCRKVYFNEILGISEHIFLSVISSSIRLVKGSKSGGQVATIYQMF